MNIGAMIFESSRCFETSVTTPAESIGAWSRPLRPPTALLLFVFEKLSCLTKDLVAVPAAMP